VLTLPPSLTLTPSHQPYPNTNANLIPITVYPNPINPKLQERIPAGPHFTICCSKALFWL